MVVGLSVTVLGCDGSYPGPGGACSGYLVRGGSTTLWVDAGSGTLAALQQHTALADVDAIVLSHEHPDHWSDIEGYRVASRYVFDRPGVAVYAPASVRRAVYGGFEAAVEWHTVADGDRVEVGDVALRFSRTDHPPETLAVRIDAGGSSLAYSADTGPEWSFAALGEGIDVALCEATWLADHEGKGGHLSARQAGAMARHAGVGRLLVTHVWPTVDRARTAAEAAEAFGHEVRVVERHGEYAV